MVELQGGDISAIDDPTRLPDAEHRAAALRQPGSVAMVAEPVAEACRRGIGKAGDRGVGAALDVVRAALEAALDDPSDRVSLVGVDVARVREAGLTPIYCLGETEQEREEGLTAQVLPPSPLEAISMPDCGLPVTRSSWVSWRSRS